MSVHICTSVSDLTDSEGGQGDRQAEELTDNALFGRGREEREGEGEGERKGEGEGGWNEAELDYEEDIVEDTQQPRRASEEDEVKVHSTEIIEEGELSSGEEGEIKDENELSDPTELTSHSSPQHSVQATPTGDHGNSESDKPASVTELDGRRTGGGEDNTEEEEEEKEFSDSEISGSGKFAARSGSPHRDRDSRMAAVCRHFLQGKCSWGKDCRFSHDDRALATHGRFHRPHPPPLPTPRQLRGGPHAFAVPFVHQPGSEFLRMPPPGSSHQPLSREEIERGPFYLPCDEQRGGGKVEVAQVAEENEGWYRLRTVANHWNSDEDTPRDLRDTQKSSKKKDEQLSVTSHDSDRERRPKKKQPHKTRKTCSSSSEESDGEMVKKKGKGLSVGDSESSSQRKKSSRRREAGSSSEEVSRKTARKRKRRDRSTSSSSEGEQRGYSYPFPPHHMSRRCLPGLPNDRYLPHGPPDPSFHPYGPPRILHGPPNQGHVLLDPYGPPPFPPHGHYIDHYGPPPYHGYDEWHSEPGRNRHLKSSNSPPPRRDSHWQKTRKHSTDSSSSSQDHSHRHRRKRASEPRKKTEKTLDRKEQLLQELSVINKVIERKKQKSGKKS